jgi:hypothetical protein
MIVMTCSGDNEGRSGRFNLGPRHAVKRIERDQTPAKRLLEPTDADRFDLRSACRHSCLHHRIGDLLRVSRPNVCEFAREVRDDVPAHVRAVAGRDLPLSQLPRCDPVGDVALEECFDRRVLVGGELAVCSILSEVAEFPLRIGL